MHVANQVVWADIPVLDLERAAAFYSKVLDIELNIVPEPEMAVFSHEQGKEASGCLYVSDTNRPSQSGPLLYLNVSGRLRAAVETVEVQGGHIVEPVHQIGPFGFRAVINDT